MAQSAGGAGNIPNVIEQAVVSLTPEASTRLKELLAREDNPQLALRVFVSGGGCSGMQYGMAFDDQRRADDVIVIACRYHYGN